MTREEQNKKQRERRKRDGNKNTIKYEKTPKGFLVRCYRNMKSRISGVQKEKWHLYKGKEILDKSYFYQWALLNTKFHDLFLDWEASSYDRKKTPSVDRIDSSKGYQLDNMEWVTHSENSRRGAVSRHRGRNTN